MIVCGYQGNEFGASYADSMCIDGFLWDADSCDEPGGPLYEGGDIPCPRCNVEAFLARGYDDAKEGGCGQCMWHPWVAMAVWETIIAKARAESPEKAEAFLAGLAPFETEDWPDREAVFAGRARWDETVERQWRYASAPFAEGEK